MYIYIYVERERERRETAERGEGERGTHKHAHKEIGLHAANCGRSQPIVRTWSRMELRSDGV